MSGSIRNKIIGYYLIVFIIIIVIFELLLFSFMRFYYYSSAEGILRNQAKYASEVYTSYLSDIYLDQVILEDRDLFYRNIDAQVQILDNSGMVYLDSIGSNNVGKVIETYDVRRAIDNSEGSYIYKSADRKSDLMSFSYPLRNRTEQTGIIRLTASLDEINRVIEPKGYIFIGFGVAVIAMALFVSVTIANSIVKPIDKLTEVASKLADGHFDVHAEESTLDEIGKLGRTLNFMTDNINKKEQLKNDFISSISHELRTPLTSIKGWAITLQSDIQAEEQPIMLEGLQIIEKESDRLKSMVEELLDFSRFTSGRIELSLEIVNMTDIVKSINKQLMPRAKNNNIDFLLNYDHEVIMTRVDKNRIKQVLINLLDNSLKFTEAGGVIMTNLISREDTIVIEVIDTGIGIDSEEISLITGKFYKGSNSNSHSGLGLSICEEIVKLHHGEMVIESVINEGTNIKVTLPRGDINE